jgi:hypothetical protein
VAVWGLPDHLGHLEAALPSLSSSGEMGMDVDCLPVPAPMSMSMSGSNAYGSGMNGNMNGNTSMNGTNGMNGLASGGLNGVGMKVRWPAKRMSVADMNKRVRALVEWVGREQVGEGERRRRRGALRGALKDSALKQKAGAGDGEGEGMDEDGEGEVGGAGGETGKLMEGLMEDLIVFQERFSRGRS